MARARRAKAKPPGVRAFVVQAGGDGVAEAVFLDRAAAEARRAALDRAARACCNPFDPGTPEQHSSDGGARFRAVLNALGLPPPAAGPEKYAWWDAVCARTTAEQRDALWDALDAWRYYEVVEVPLED